MNDKYTLGGPDGRTPIPEPDLMRWCDQFERGEVRIVAKDALDGDVRVSTVFLGIDYSFGHGPPLLFETMIFNGPLTERQWRCSTWAEAEAQHAHALRQAKAGKLDE